MCYKVIIPNNILASLTNFECIFMQASSNLKDIDLNQFAYNPKSSIPCPIPTTPKTASRATPLKHQYFTPPTNKAGLSSSSYIAKQKRLDDDCQMIEDDVDFEEDFVDEMGDERYPDANASFKQVDGKQSSFDSFMPNSNAGKFGYEVVNERECKDQNQNDIGSGMSGMEEKMKNENGLKKDDRCGINMDWPELDIYQRKRKEFGEGT